MTSATSDSDEPMSGVQALFNGDLNAKAAGYAPRQDWTVTSPSTLPEHVTAVALVPVATLAEPGRDARQYVPESGQGRYDVNGVEWFACDPYPTWYRVVDRVVVCPDTNIQWRPEQM